MFSRRFQCRNRSCWAFEGYRSRRRTFLEKYLLRLFLLKPVRCADCFRRVYVPLWVHARFEKDVAGLGPRIGGASLNAGSTSQDSMIQPAAYFVNRSA